jgi:4'-phosphopantetheinyl transferase
MSSPDHWSASPAASPIPPREVHVWRAGLDGSEFVRQHLEATLAPEEIARANRFFFPRDRQHFVAARGILRQLLSGYLGRPPADLEFAYHPRGKPYLLPQPTDVPIAFNVSHSHGLALLAFSLGREIGVDLERVRLNIASDEIASRYFAPREVAELQSLPSEQRPEAFFLCWTRKEAYIKALGEGLQIPLTSFRVSLTPQQPDILESADASRWTLRSLSPAPDYAAALVAEGHDWQLRLFDWQPTKPL